MKKSIVLIGFILFFSVLFQSHTIILQDEFEDIAIAVKSGDSKALAKYFSSMVELTINGEENIYSKKQAELVLKNFFEKYPPQNFTIRHKGASAKGLPYIIGDLETSSGHFRTYILFKEINQVLSIQEIQFDKE